MNKVWDYKWFQLSMWDFAPQDSIQWFQLIRNGLTDRDVVCHFYLRQCIEVVSENHHRWRDVLVGELTDEQIKELKK